jgi:hypothetical protein
MGSEKFQHAVAVVVSGRRKWLFHAASHSSRDPIFAWAS